MKRIITFVVMVVVLFTSNIMVFATENADIEKAANTLVPYEDSHIMTRQECLKVLNRVIGINDDIILAEISDKFTDYYPKIDIEYETYAGRFADLGIYYFEMDVPKDKNRFLGEENAVKIDILRWMAKCLLVNNSDNSVLTDEEKLIGNLLNHGIIKVEEINKIQDILTAGDYKTYIGRFLMCETGNFYKIGDSPNNFYYTKADDEGRTYFDVFNETYDDKIIYIKADGIYLGENKIQYNGVQPFIDETGTMLMPIRWFAQMSGYDKTIEWNEETLEIVLTNDKDNKIKFSINLDICEFINKIAGDFSFDKSASIIDDVTYLPMRSVCEGFTFDVIWCK